MPFWLVALRAPRKSGGLGSAAWDLEHQGKAPPPAVKEGTESDNDGVLGVTPSWGAAPLREG